MSIQYCFNYYFSLKSRFCIGCKIISLFFGCKENNWFSLINFLRSYNQYKTDLTATNHNCFQITQNCSTLLTMCKWKGKIDQCNKYFKQSLSRDGLCCSFNYYTFPDKMTLKEYKHYFCRAEKEFLSFIRKIKKIE